MNTIQSLDQHGQSIWLDFVSRGLIARGELKKMIDEWGIQGLTSNPSIFQKAVEQSADYAELFEKLAPEKLSPPQFFERLAVRDIRDAADHFKGVYERTKRRDGYVSIEVSPKLAQDAKGTLEEARRLWREVGRDNVMVKIPGTTECLPAIEQALSEGININITLLFSQQRYSEVVDAYFKGIEAFGRGGGDVSRLASVASFFVSRIDSLVDANLQKKIDAGGADAARAQALLGKVAIANAKLAYQIFEARFGDARWAALAAKGAQPQRLLWASTSTKNPKYRDVIYIEELVGKHTVNTVPQGTLEAFLDHGKVRDALTEDVEAARRTMQELEAVGVSMKQVTDQLVEEGVRLFDASFDKLLAAIAKRLA